MLDLETEQEKDGRWIAEIKDLLVVLAYGATRSEAIDAAEALALRVLADRHINEGPLELQGVSNKKHRLWALVNWSSGGL